MAGRGISLVQLASELLKKEPLHTLELAERVMGLSGHERAASAAVFSLLGPDPRFRVDADGWWRLDDALGSVGSSLGFLDYAVVDVETTGGPVESGHQIIEVAIVEIQEGVITSEFQSLIHPGQSISNKVSRLTGITNVMVASAPHFDEIAEEIYRRLERRVFVAHNARFDWGFISAQLGQCLGDAPDVERVCTVELSRRLLRSQRRHHLDALSRHFGIRIHGRHRALGDAMATAQVLIRLLDEAALRGISDLHALRLFLAPDDAGADDPVGPAREGTNVA